MVEPETMRMKGLGICVVFAVLVIVSSTHAGAEAEVERKSVSEFQSQSLEIRKDRVCNGTIMECIGEEEELLIGFKVNGRSLAQNPNHISYGALQKNQICNAKIYGNCIGPKGRDSRPCSYYNRCQRGNTV